MNQFQFEWLQTKVAYQKINNIELEKLNASIENEEVRHAVFNMNLWKAPGPDSFPVGFFQKSWHIMS